MTRELSSPNDDHENSGDELRLEPLTTPRTVGSATQRMAMLGDENRPRTVSNAPRRETTESTLVPGRVASIDVFRGIVMFLMLAECLHLCQLSAAKPDESALQLLCYHQTHVEWRGCSIHDLIQPGFSFLVGVALPFSIAKRRRNGQNILLVSFHALWRAVLLVGLGIFLRSLHSDQTYFTFEDTLTQIGLGYFFLFLLGWGKGILHWTSFVLLLVGYFAAFAAFPLPDAEFDWTQTGVTSDWEHNATGFAAHWNKNSNVAWEFDRWFLNLFPRDEEFQFNSGGYSTLSFIPTLATMILGLIAGTWLREVNDRGELLMRLFGLGALLVVVGLFLDATDICPSVKRIWTPSWVLFSGGICLAFLGALHILVDWMPLRRLFVPISIFGMNSIVAYCLSWLTGGFFQDAIRRHVGERALTSLGDEYETLFVGAGQLLIFWLILFWLYRKRIMIRI